MNSPTTEITPEERGILRLLGMQYTAAKKCRQNHGNRSDHPGLPISIGICTEDIGQFQDLCGRGLLAIALTGHGYSILATEAGCDAVGIDYWKYDPESKPPLQ